MLQALTKHLSKHSHLQVLKQCPSPHLTSPHLTFLTTHVPAPSSLPVLLTPMLEPAAAAVQKRTAHARQRQQQKPTHKKPPGGHPNMPINNQRQADALTEIITVIRCTKHHTNTPDWHEKATMNVLRDNRNHPAPYPNIVQALTKYATTSDKRVPTFMFDALADWAPPGHTAPRNPCEDHPEQSATNCPSCLADYKTGLRPKELIGKKHDIPMTG